MIASPSFGTWASLTSFARISSTAPEYNKIWLDYERKLYEKFTVTSCLCNRNLCENLVQLGQLNFFIFSKISRHFKTKTYPDCTELAVIKVSNVVHTSCCFHSNAKLLSLVRTAFNKGDIADFIGSMSIRNKYSRKWKSETACNKHMV